MRLRIPAIAMGTAVAGTLVAIFTMTGNAAAHRDPNHAMLAEIRAATARYHSPKQAARNGYVPDSPCETSPDGGMGVHYVNFAAIGDPAIDPTRPEILLYVPRPNGTVELVGVEFFKIDDDGSLATDGDRPFLGGVPFDGPMSGHNPQMPAHYDLHVWLFEDNPSGTFAPWNPQVEC